MQDLLGNLFYSRLGIGFTSIIVAVWFVALGLAGCQSRQANESKVKICAVEGQAFCKTRSGRWVSATKGLQAAKTNWFKTDANCRVEICIGDRGAIGIEPDSEVKVICNSPDRPLIEVWFGAVHGSIRVDKGWNLTLGGGYIIAGSDPSSVGLARFRLKCPALLLLSKDSTPFIVVPFSPGTDYSHQVLTPGGYFDGEHRKITNATAAMLQELDVQLERLTGP